MLASSLTMSNYEIQVRVYQKWIVSPLFDNENIEEGDAYVVSTYEVDKEDWRQPVINYIKYQKVPKEQHKRFDIYCRAPVSSYTKIRYIKNHLKVYSCAV